MGGGERDCLVDEMRCRFLCLMDGWQSVPFDNHVCDLTT